VSASLLLVASFKGCFLTNNLHGAQSGVEHTRDQLPNCSRYWQKYQENVEDLAAASHKKVCATHSSEPDTKPRAGGYLACRNNMHDTVNN
jgi:hypothetical protein